MSLPTTPLEGPLAKIPLAPFYTPLFCPRQARDQRNVDSPSAAVRAAARGLLYGQEQMAVAQVDLRLVSAVARPPTTVTPPSTRLLLGVLEKYPYSYPSSPYSLLDI